jgi:hypothetical protein
MPTGLKRYYGKRHLHFITFSCYRRLPLLKSARDVFVEELGKTRDELEFHLIGYVVMPEHEEQEKNRQPEMKREQRPQDPGAQPAPGAPFVSRASW